MHFLITNDDGYAAPGIVALEQALSALGEVTVVAPKDHLSGCSHQVTTDRPLRLEQPEQNHYVVDALPADCIRVALGHLQIEPDWIVSGINEGANLGCDLCYSGTVAAAREAVLFGQRAIAISHYLRPEIPIEWDLAAERGREIISGLLAKPLPIGSLWNVNLPTADRLADATIADCEPDPHPLAVAYEATEGLLHYRHGRYHDRPRFAGFDVDVCFSGKIAVSQVPIYALTNNQ